MTAPISPPLCPDCGTPLPPESPQALCPACLLRQALASRTLVADSGDPPPLPPPTPEEMADKFPQFEITSCLGRGGMGVVYKARQKSLNRWVAIKILRQDRVGEEKFAERFAREAQTLARLNHPNIVTVFDYGETAGLFYIVMEFVDGVNLRDLLRDGKLAPKQALAIVPPICEALQYAHDKGIVHRDIKPENLLLDRDGRIKIADFGIAALVGAGGEAAGTPPYMAPEQAGTAAEIDHRADIYALGVVLYEMLTGERPTKDVVAPSRKVQLDVRIDEMVLKALDKTPELRYQTAGEFRRVVETLAGSAAEPPAATPPPVPPPLVAAQAAAANPDAAIKAAAIAMMIVSGLSSVVLIFGSLIAWGMILFVRDRVVSVGSLPRWASMIPVSNHGTMILSHAALMSLMVLWIVVVLLGQVVPFLAGVQMSRLRHYRFAIAGAVVMIVLGLTGGVLQTPGAPGFAGTWALVELGVGIWALVVVLRPGTKALFAATARPVSPREQLAVTAADPADARQWVAAPAIGLMVASGLNLLLAGGLVLALVMLTLLRAGPFPASPPSGGMVPAAGLLSLPLVALVFVGLPALLTFIGAWRMRRLKGYGLAVTAAILAIITPPGLLVGLAFGIWALMVLARPDVQAAFQREQSRATGRGCLLAGFALLGVLVLAILVIIGLRLLLPHHRTASFSPATPQVHPQNSPTPLSGQVIERSLALNTDGTSDLLDPRSGEVTPAPTPAQWTIPGLFIHRDAALVETMLTGANGALAQESRADQWDHLSNTQALATLRASSSSQGMTIGAVGHGDLPQTFLFKTLTGEIGILQVLRFSDNPRSVTFRYKWVEDAAGQPASKPAEAIR